MSNYERPVAGAWLMGVLFVHPAQLIRSTLMDSVRSLHFYLSHCYTIGWDRL